MLESDQFQDELEFIFNMYLNQLNILNINVNNIISEVS